MILGGGQEHGFSSGTENVANIVGFGKACDIAKTNIHENLLYGKIYRNILVQNVLNEISQVTINGHPESRITK